MELENPRQKRVEKRVYRGIEFYRSLDWSLPRQELARIAGVNLSRIDHWRPKVGAPPSKRGPKPRVDWDSVDWSKGDDILSQELGVERNYVYMQRRQLGDGIVVTQGKTSGSKRTLDWDSVDWSMKNGEIAEILGCKPGAVYVHRCQCAGSGEKRWKNNNIDWSKADWSKLDREIAIDLSCSQSAVNKKRVKLGIALPRARVAWESVDWSRSNAEIAELVGRTRQMVYLMRRRYGNENGGQDAEN